MELIILEEGEEYETIASAADCPAKDCCANNFHCGTFIP